MKLAEVMVELTKERDEQWKIRQAADVQVAKLDRAIAALNGKTVQRVEAPTVIQMVETAARSFTPGIMVINAANLRRATTEQFPASEDKIKRSIYCAIDKLKQKKVLLECPGGFTVAP